MIKQLIWLLRAGLCETFIGWSLKVAPKDYTPTTVECAIAFYDVGRKEAK